MENAEWKMKNGAAAGGGWSGLEGMRCKGRYLLGAGNSLPCGKNAGCLCLTLDFLEWKNCPSPMPWIEIFDAGRGFSNLPPRLARAMIAA